MQGRISFEPRGWSLCFKTLLEWDFFILHFFDDTVVDIEEQPVIIEWQDKTGKKHKYVPDARITYTDGSVILFEVTSRRILEKETEELAEKFAAAQDYAAERGWKFSVVTENDIRTERLANSKFLYPFATERTPPHHAACFFHALHKTEQCKASIAELLELVAGTEEERGVMQRSMWQLLAQGKLKADLEKSIKPTTNLSLNVDAWTGLTPLFDALSEKQQKISKERYDILEELLDAPQGEKGEKAEALVKEHSVSVRTLYNWYHRFQSTGKVSSLINRREIRGSHRFRLSKKQLSVINRVAEEYYETPQKPSMQRAIEQVQIACKEERGAFLSDRSIRRHINNRDLYRATANREGAQIARDRLIIVYGKSHQEINQPLSVVQIDHTIIDIELVDDEERLPIGRPVITIALDVFSRAIMGFFVSFEDTSLLTAGLCLDHAMFPKDDWLKSHDIDGSWPVWGKPVCLHVDDAIEFPSNELEDFCGEYGVRLEYRPVQTPHYGGHVERVFRTIAEQIHILPETTFSHPKQKGEYNSTKKAVMTLKEFQRWLGTYITVSYLNKVHSSLGMTPLEKWAQGIRETGDRLGVPPILADRDGVRTLLLPTYERTLQRDGICLDHIHYFSDVSHALFLESKGKNQRKKIKIKRDPRDISYIMILDESRKKWFKIPYRDQAHPSLNLWQWESNYKRVDKNIRSEKTLFDAYKKKKVRSLYLVEDSDSENEDLLLTKKLIESITKTPINV